MSNKRYSIVGLVILAIVLVVTLRGSQSLAQAEAQEILASNVPAVQGALSLGLSTVDAVQVAALPLKKTCDQADSGERIKCKTENLVGQVDYTVDQLSEAGVFRPEQAELFRNESERAKEKVSRADARDFKNLTKKSRPECDVVEYVTDDPEDPYYGDGDDDGICITKGPGKEMCLEDNSDGIGNNDSLCEKLHEKGGKPISEPCAQICDVDALEADEGNFDPAAAQETEGSLDDIGAVFDEINPQIAARMELVATMEALAASQDSVAAGECADLLKGTHLFDYAALQGIQAGNWGAKLGADICDAACNQDVLGNNCSAVCTALRVAENVLGALEAGFALYEDDVTGQRFDASLECLQVLGQQINDIKDGVDEANRKLDEVIRLLNLPAGKRPEFPGCDLDGKCDPNEDAENCPADCGG